jgi:polyphosphate kinase
VYSIVGRYLEHSRIYYFENNGEPEIYLSSADWMGRNLNRRVESLFPVNDKDCFNQVLAVLGCNLKDNVKSRKQNSDGTYKRVESGKIEFNCQDELYS